MDRLARVGGLGGLQRGEKLIELTGAPDHLDAAIAYLEEVGCTVNTMEGDVIEG